MNVNGTNATLQIWDTTGQERFRKITSTYYRGAHGIIVVFDVTDPGSFQNVRKWLEEIMRYASEDVQKILIGNKCDKCERSVSYEEASRFAEEMGLLYVETSAKNNSNIDMSFEKITSVCLNRPI